MRCDAWIIAVLSGQKTRLGRGRRRATRRNGARSHERVRPAEMAPPQGVASRNGKPGATRGRKASGLLGDSGASERGPVCGWRVVWQCFSASLSASRPHQRPLPVRRCSAHPRCSHRTIPPSQFLGQSKRQITSDNLLVSTTPANTYGCAVTCSLCPLVERDAANTSAVLVLSQAAPWAARAAA
jgi:hypothetical protein